jgi:hypothetical protein
MKSLLATILSLFFHLSCLSQSPKSVTKNTLTVNPCNQSVYGTVKYIAQLPNYICIPDGFVIDDYVRFSTLGDSKKKDFLAIKFNLREDDQEDGDSTFWRFYTQDKQDTIFRLTHSLGNIVPPFIKNISYDYLIDHATADEIFNNYPRRLIHRLAFVVTHDTLKLSYKFDDSYGKTFVFIYDQQKKDWFLETLEYFIGELPTYWWRVDDFYYSLRDNIKVIEVRNPKNKIRIGEFNLRMGFKYRDVEQAHLVQSHIDRVDESKWKSIESANFDKCHIEYLPNDWRY